MSNKFHSYKQALIDFFTGQGYLVYANTATKKITYLYAKDAKIPVIKVGLVNKQPGQKVDKELTYLKGQISEQLQTTLEAVNVLEVYLTNSFEENFVKKDNTIIVIADNWDYLTHALQIDFPGIENQSDPYNESSSGNTLTDNDFNIEDVKSPEDLKKRLGALNSQLKNGNATATMIISFFFLAVPFIMAIISLFLFSQVGSSAVRGLIFGGSTYSLTILGGQWWRIFTYGFSSGGDIVMIIFLLILAWVGFKRLRLNELMMGTWKMLGGFLLAYVLTGFILSVLSPIVVTGGDGIAFAIIIGMIALNTGGSKSALATTAKSQLIMPIILLVIFGFLLSFTGLMMAIPSMLMGFIVGGTMSFMLTYDYKELNWRLWVALVLLVALILMPIVFLLIPTYVPGVNDNVIKSLSIYLNLNWISVDQANNIVHKIGWEYIDWNKVGSWIWISYK